jgi:PIN domain nuclease of toxin-antitoxin system
VAIAVADAHALVWSASGAHRKLGRGARALLERAEQGKATIYVPTIALVEVAEAVHRGTLRVTGSFSQWVSALLARKGFVPVDLTFDVLLAAEALYAIPERGDRLIAATALHLECPLITRDPAIARAANIETIW